MPSSGKITSYRPFRLDEMEFVLSKSWWISNTRVTSWYLPNIRRHLVSDRSNFSPDRHFLPPDVWPLYSNLSKQREGEGLQGDPEGPWGVAGVGDGEGHRQKTPAHVTWWAAASRSVATRKANKGNVGPPGCMRMMQIGEAVHRVCLAPCTAIAGLWEQLLLSLRHLRGGVLRCGDADWAQVRSPAVYSRATDAGVSYTLIYCIPVITALCSM